MLYGVLPVHELFVTLLYQNHNDN